MGLILNRLLRSLSESSGLGGFEDSSVSLVAGSGDSSEDGELDVVLPEQVGLGSSDVVLLVEDGSSDDGDGVPGGSVVTGHFHVELADSSIERDVSVLLVHVVNSGSGLISEDNAEGFDMVGSFFIDFVDGKNLTLSCFGLELPSKMIPELGFSDNFVGSEQSEGIDFGVGILLSREFSTEN